MEEKRAGFNHIVASSIFHDPLNLFKNTEDALLLLLKAINEEGIFEGRPSDAREKLEVMSHFCNAGWDTNPTFVDAYHQEMRRNKKLDLLARALTQFPPSEGWLLELLEKIVIWLNAGQIRKASGALSVAAKWSGIAEFVETQRRHEWRPGLVAILRAIHIICLSAFKRCVALDVRGASSYEHNKLDVIDPSVDLWLCHNEQWRSLVSREWDRRGVISKRWLILAKLIATAQALGFFGTAADAQYPEFTEPPDNEAGHSWKDHVRSLAQFNANLTPSAPPLVTSKTVGHTWSEIFSEEAMSLLSDGQEVVRRQFLSAAHASDWNKVAQLLIMRRPTTTGWVDLYEIGSCAMSDLVALIELDYDVERCRIALPWKFEMKDGRVRDCTVGDASRYKNTVDPPHPAEMAPFWSWDGIEDSAGEPNEFVVDSLMWHHLYRDCVWLGDWMEDKQFTGGVYGLSSSSIYEMVDAIKLLCEAEFEARPEIDIRVRKRSRF